MALALEKAAYQPEGWRPTRQGSSRTLRKARVAQEAR